MEKRKRILILIITAIIILLAFGLFRSCYSDNSTDKPTPKTSTLDFVPAKNNTNSIVIPATNGLNFKAAEINQSVDFYNPSENNCVFVMSLYLSDSTLLWKSDYIQPSENISEITIAHPLEKGLYKNCKLVYECYSLDEQTKLNGSEIKLEINSK